MRSTSESDARPRALSAEVVRAVAAAALVAAAVAVPEAVDGAAAGALRVALGLAGFTLLTARLARVTERVLRG